jgi:polyhydroxyalkanoate synthesis repressor PhaR
MLQNPDAAKIFQNDWCGAIPSANLWRMAQKLRTIKKYPNRRLYDTEISSYITLEEVRQLVLDGETFEVRDAKSGEDLTRSVLLQIISEHEDKGQPMLSPQLLSQIIRFYGDSLQGFMGPYLERSLQVFLDQQQQFRTQLNSLLGQTPWQMLNDLTERNMDAWKSMQRGFIDAAGRPQPGGPGPSDPFANRPAGTPAGGSNRPGKKTG